MPARLARHRLALLAIALLTLSTATPAGLHAAAAASAVQETAQEAAGAASVLQLGLFRKEGEARWAWQSVQRHKLGLAEGLTPEIVPLGPGKSAGVALRALAPSGMDVRALCRRMVGAGFGCLVLEEAAAPPAAATPAPAPAPVPARIESAALPVPAQKPAFVAAPPPPPPATAALPTENVVTYSEEEARTMRDIETSGRRKGRLGAVIPDTPYDVMPALLKRENWNLCALTFDDGPHRTVTREILDVLNRERIRATYFPVAKVAAKHGELIRDFLAAGHEIGNHSLSHGDMRAMSPEAQRFEIAEANRILREFGADPVLFRPPYGRYTLGMLSIAREERMSPVLWTVDTRDWQVRDPDKIVQHVKTAAGTGSVLLLHSTYASTLNALPRVISEMRAKGCEFVTLSEWIARMRQLAMPYLVNASEPVVSASANAPAAARN